MSNQNSMSDLYTPIYMTISMQKRFASYRILTVFVTQILLRLTKIKPYDINQKPIITTLKPKL